MKIKIYSIFGLLIILIGCAVVVHTYKFEIKSYSLRKIKNESIASVTGDKTDSSWIKNWGVDGFTIVEISTDKDILELTRRHSLNFSVEAWFCAQPKIVVQLNIPGIYTEGKSLIDWHLISAKTGKVDKTVNKAIFKYSIVLFQSWNADLVVPDAFKKDKTQTHYLKYDLKENPQDICLSINGGNMTSEIISNQIILPALEIQETFK